MTDKLAEFINELDQNPALVKEYETNPKDALQKFGVSEKDIDLLLNKDLSAIKARLEMSGIKAFMVIKSPN